MTKRNIILIAIILAILTAFGFAYFYFYKPANQGGEGSGGTNFLSEFFPFGEKTNTNNSNTENPVDVSGYIPPSDTEDINLEKLIKVSSMPIAGYGVFTKERYKEIETTPPEQKETKPTPPQTEFVPFLRYVERATGNIYQTFTDKIDERKFTITTIPQVYEAYFGNKGESVIMRYLKQDNKTIETFVGELPKELLGGDTAEQNEVKGSFLPENIKDISMSPGNTSLFYLFNNENGAIGVTASTNGSKKNQILNSSFTEWLSQWPNDRMITLNTKPSFNVEGYMYSLDPANKKITKILSGINGLTTLTSPSGKLILYSNNSLNLKIYNINTQDSVSFGLRTLPEKCVWGSNSTFVYCAVPKYIDGLNYPDIWYQGENSFSDEIWKIDTENGSTTMLVDPSTLAKGEEIDGIKLSLDESENYLFFINKKDSYLWEFKLN